MSDDFSSGWTAPGWNVQPSSTQWAQNTTSWPANIVQARRSFSMQLRILPLGDVDAPLFCMGCGQDLVRTSTGPGGRLVYNPYRPGVYATLLMCQQFEMEPAEHDAWVLP